MSDVIVTINIPGEPYKNNDRMLRAVCESGAVEDLRKLVTAMMKKSTDFEIGNKKAKPSYQRARTLKKAEETENDDHIIPGVDATVKRALDDTAELAAV
jgi:hypothetical protein